MVLEGDWLQAMMPHVRGGKFPLQEEPWVRRLDSGPTTGVGEPTEGWIFSSWRVRLETFVAPRGRRGGCRAFGSGGVGRNRLQSLGPRIGQTKTNDEDNADDDTE